MGLWDYRKTLNNPTMDRLSNTAVGPIPIINHAILDLLRERIGGEYGI